MNERQLAAALPLANLRKHRRATAALSALVDVSITRHGHRPGEAVDERPHVAHSIAIEAIEDVLRLATSLHQRRLPPDDKLLREHTLARAGHRLESADRPPALDQRHHQPPSDHMATAEPPIRHLRRQGPNTDEAGR